MDPARSCRFSLVAGTGSDPGPSVVIPRSDQIEDRHPRGGIGFSGAQMTESDGRETIAIFCAVIALQQVMGVSETAVCHVIKPWRSTQSAARRPEHRGQSLDG